MVDNAFFLDSCIIFNKILHEDSIRIDKFVDDLLIHNIKCYVNKSILNECDKKINDTFNFIIEILKDSLKSAFLEQFRIRRRDENNILSYRDIQLLEQIFLDTFYIPRDRRRRPYTRPLISAIKSIENYIVIFMEKELNSNKDITLNYLFEEITKELMKYEIIIREKYEDIENEFKNIEYTNELAPLELVDELIHEIHRTDCNHLIAMLIYSGKHNLNSIFITTDYGILCKKEVLERTFKIKTSNPIYAINYIK